MNSDKALSTLDNITRRLVADARRSDFQGYDPFDGLNSQFFTGLRLNNIPLARIAWLQFHKRSPINIRGIVGVKAERNAKGIALFILGLLSTYARTNETSYLELATDLGDWLLESAVDRTKWTHFAWGYHFDWAARAFYVPRGKPNAITTCYVARALYSLGSVTACSRFTEAAIDSGRFLDGLFRSSEEGDYFAYIPGEKAFVHNANLWAAALVAKSGRFLGDRHMLERALTATRQSVSMQRSDGSWMYGTRAHHGFIDGFHTGYNLEALSEIGDTLATGEFKSAIDNGLDYYRRTFVLPDGTVKYYNDDQWPLDTHSFAQAILTLSKVGRSEEDFDLTEKVITQLISKLYVPRAHRFVYQKGRFFANKINYLRWTQAWAFYALSSYLDEVYSNASSYARSRNGKI